MPRRLYQPPALQADGAARGLVDDVVDVIGGVAGGAHRQKAADAREGLLDAKHGVACGIERAVAVFVHKNQPAFHPAAYGGLIGA
jgi:hypothetical protein